MDYSQVPIIFGKDVKNTNEQEVRESSRFREWISLFEVNREITLKSVQILAVYKWGRPKEIKMMHLVAEAYDSAGRKPGGITTLRGGTVDVLAVLTCEGEDYVVFVAQNRVPAAQRVISNPSGMLDGDESVRSASFRELEEELSCKFPWGELIDLGEEVLDHRLPYLTSSGTSDERAHMLLTRTEVTRRKLESLHGKFGGLQEENEETQVIVVPISRAFQMIASMGSASIKTAFSLMLYQQYLHQQR